MSINENLNDNFDIDFDKDDSELQQMDMDKPSGEIRLPEEVKLGGYSILDDLNKRNEENKSTGFSIGKGLEEIGSSSNTNVQPKIEEFTSQEDEVLQEQETAEPVVEQDEEPVVEQKKQTEEKFDNERSTTLKNYILFIISDKVFSGMLGYFRHYGSKVSKIFSNIEEAKNELMMQVDPCKIVVIDSGTGRFTGMSARNQLLELMSLSDNENRVAIFYTDSVIREEARNHSDIQEKDITWHNFKNMAGVLAVLLQNLKKENYVYDSPDSDTYQGPSEDCLNIIGGSTKGMEEASRPELVMSLNDFFQNSTSDFIQESYNIRV